MATNNINNLPDNREFSMEDLEQISGGYISPDPETQARWSECTKALDRLPGIQRVITGMELSNLANNTTMNAKDIEEFMKKHGLV